MIAARPPSCPARRPCKPRRTSASSYPTPDGTPHHYGPPRPRRGLFNPYFVTLGHERPMPSVGRVLLAELDAVRRAPDVHHPEMGGLAALGIVPGEGPGRALDQHAAGVHLAPTGGDGVAGVAVRLGVIHEHQQRLGFAVHDLIAGEEAAAPPAVVPEDPRFAARLAEGRIEMPQLGLPGAGVGHDLVEALWDGGASGQDRARHEPQHGHDAAMHIHLPKPPKSSIKPPTSGMKFRKSSIARRRDRCMAGGYGIKCRPCRSLD